MAFSTIAQFRLNVPKIIIDDYIDSNVTLQIAEADKRVKQDLNRLIDFDLIPAIGSSPDTPDFINLLSQYKTAELVLKSVFGAKREVTEVSDIQYWQRQYSNPMPPPGEEFGLLEKIKLGMIVLELSDGTDVKSGPQRFTRDSRPNIKPALGVDEFGEFKNNDDLEEERPQD